MGRWRKKDEDEKKIEERERGRRNEEEEWINSVDLQQLKGICHRANLLKARIMDSVIFIQQLTTCIIILNDICFMAWVSYGTTLLCE